MRTIVTREVLTCYNTGFFGGGDRDMAFTVDGLEDVLWVGIHNQVPNCIQRIVVSSIPPGPGAVRRCSLSSTTGMIDVTLPLDIDTVTLDSNGLDLNLSARMRLLPHATEPRLYATGSGGLLYGFTYDANGLIYPRSTYSVGHAVEM